MFDPLTLFSPETALWFASEIGQPTAVQCEGWPAIASGGDALVSAPTGTGKTLTAFLWFIDRLNAEAREGALPDELRVLYISPLKSLANDIRENLDRPLKGLSSPIRTAVRNGDTPPSERARMARRPPHMLLTTPESLYLLLTSDSGRRMLSTVRAVVVDELHALIGSKRGTHLMLSLERLDALTGRRVQRIGLSATIRPLELAAEYLSGGGAAARIVAPEITKEIDVKVRVAPADLRALPEKSVWPEICEAILQLTEQARTVLVFCEGRATAEKVAMGVNAIGGDIARTHHGSLSKEKRLEAERMLRAGELKVLCATSSMELGIDVGEVDVVVQVGCPQHIMSAVQRLGRAGHRPGQVSRMIFYPRTHQDLILQAFTAQAARDKAIEQAHPPECPLDVLSQHLVSMAAAEGFAVREGWALVKGCFPYRNLSLARFEQVLAMLAGDYEHAQDRPVSPRVHYDRIGGRVDGGPGSRMLALSSGGTIPDRGLYMVTLEDNVTRLGELDEEFVFEARLGDSFMLGAFSWRIVSIERDRVIVRPSTSMGVQPPFWKGDGMDRDYETGVRFGRAFAEINEACAAGRTERAFHTLTEDTDSATNAARYVAEQIAALGLLATNRALIAEYFRDESGDNLMMLHSVFGGRVNRALAMLLKDETERLTGGDARVWYDDDGVLMHLTGGGEIPRNLISRLDSEGARGRVQALLPGTALFTMAFRYNAGRALMMGARPGGRVPLWVQRMRGAESFARALAFPDHPLLVETMRECLEDYLDIPALTRVLADVAAGRVRLVERRVEKPSPMSLGLRRAVEMEMMYDYSPMPSGAAQLAVDMKESPIAIEPDRAFIEQAGARRKAPEDEEQLHDLLMIEGDLTAEEIDAPYGWLEHLAAGRALYIEPGLWIAAEQQALYDAALQSGDREAKVRLARRAARYRGPVTAGWLAERYLWEDEEAAELLRALAAEGTLIEKDGEYTHRDVYERAQRMTLSARRREAATVPAARYASLLARWQQVDDSPREQLRAAVERLAGLPLPVALWEEVVFPVRAAHYRSKMLDELLARGDAAWRLIPGERRAVQFDLPGDIDWESDAPSMSETAVGERARRVMEVLARRGASFAHALSAALGGESVAETLNELVALGAVCCDGFAPVRLLDLPARPATARMKVKGRLSAQDAGRWDLVRPARALSPREKLDRMFSRWAIVCRETAAIEGADWRNLLTQLRAMEFTGEVRRGYFVKGLSGAQFVRKEDYLRITAMLADPGDHREALCAVDPMQAWGRILPLPEGASFLCVPGTVVVTRDGEPVLVLERQGAAIRAFLDDPASYTVAAEAFRRERIYPGLRSLTVRQYPPEAAPYLENAGFVREMRDYVLYKA